MVQKKLTVEEQWDYFGYLEEKVPKCYLSGSDF
jgi:hypothetical protein